MNRLTALREALGFSIDEVALIAEMSKDAVRRLERNPESLSDEQADRLSRMYGRDVLDVLDAPEDEQPEKSPMATLLKAKSDVLDANSRFAITEAMWIARRIRAIRQRWDMPSGWLELCRFHDNSDYSHPSGGNAKRLAKIVRERLELGILPIASVQRDVLERFHILTLCVEMPGGPDAQAFAEPELGGVILLNVCSPANKSAFGRRITLTHELAHLLFDRHRMRDVVDFCSVEASDQPQDDALAEQEAIERRARAFAVVLLAPFEAVAADWRRRVHESRQRRVRAIMTHFGLGYAATRSHLHNTEPRLLNRLESVGWISPAVPHEWEERDPMPCRQDPLLKSIPVVRRGALLSTLRTARAQGLLSDEAVRQELGVPIRDWAKIRPEVLVDQTPTGWLPSSARSE